LWSQWSILLHHECSTWNNNVDKPATFGERMKEARLATAVRLRRTLSQAGMAELVGKEIGRDLWQAQWSKYELDESEPPLDVIRAASKLSGLDPSYIAFGTTAAVQQQTIKGAMVAAPPPEPVAKSRRAKGG
jgi:transcriptional regulator with XRE-family HTH domain